MKIIILFISAIVSLMILDMFWLGYLAKDFYDQQIGILLRKSGSEMAPIWWAAACVYFFIALGILVFVLPKAEGNYFLALGYGALLGAITYGIYDFTNYSVLANWPLKVVFIDVAWGMMLCGLSSFSVCVIQKRFLN